MAPPLLPLSGLAGKLTLSFTSAVQAPVSEPPPNLPPEAGSVVPAPPASSTPPQPVTPLEPAPVLADPAVQREPDDARPAAPPPTLRPFLLRATERRHFFTLFAGGSRFMRGGYSYPPGGNQLKLEAAIGGHSKALKSLAGAAVLQVRSSYPLTTFTIAPRLQFDIPIVPDYAIYFTTNLTAGYRVLVVSDPDTGYDGPYGPEDSGPTIYHGVVGAVGFGVSTIVAERLLLSFRPANFEIEAYKGIDGIILSWDILGGIGVVW